MLANLYDFDKTVYPRDSGVDFLKYCIRNHPHLIKCLPKILFFGLRFILKIGDNDKNKSKMYCFVKGVDIQKLAQDFWDEKGDEIYSFFLPQNRELPTVVCSASPEFLLDVICKKLKVDVLIATKINSKTGVLESKNCKHNEKVARIKAQIPDYEFANVYSDSFETDKPILKLGQRAFILKKGNMKEVFID